MPQDSASAIAICALIRREDGRYLLIQRAPNLAGGGFWCPITGRPEEGEELKHTVVREVQEEVGMHVTVGPEVFKCPTSDGRFTLRWFKCTPNPPSVGFEPLKLRRQEVSDARWVTAKEASLLDPTFESTAAFFSQLGDTE